MRVPKHIHRRHTLCVSFSASPPFSSPLQKTPALCVSATSHRSLSPPSPILSLAPSGLHSYLLTGSESFVTSFQFLTFQLEPRLLLLLLYPPSSANKQENALSEKTVVHPWKSQKRKVGGFDKYILRERPLILPPSLHLSPFLHLLPSLFHTSLSLCLSFSNSLLTSAEE